MEDMLLEMKCGIFFEHDGVPPHFGCQVIAYLNQCYKNHWIGRCGPVAGLLRSLDLTLFDFFLCGSKKEMTFRTRVHMSGTDCTKLWILLLLTCKNALKGFSRQ
jgi:hypothetical protein